VPPRDIPEGIRERGASGQLQFILKIERFLLPFSPDAVVVVVKFGFVA
jgi:hypothetical protein